MDEGTRGRGDEGGEEAMGRRSEGTNERKDEWMKGREGIVITKCDIKLGWN